jgi:hypothetical protein
MFYTTLQWHGPFNLASLDFSQLPNKSGVYVFTEDSTSLKPNPPRLVRKDENYESVNELLRGTPCILYVGKATTLSTRVRGYRFKPYMLIRRRSGPTSRHEVDPHKGRALLHAQQYFEGPIFLRWAETPNPETVESALLRELNPVLNTAGLELQCSAIAAK